MRQASVLYVEDNEYNRKIVRQLLTRTPYRLREATDGEAALGMARQERPDLILMDVQLPRMSGLEAARAVLSARPDLRVLHVRSLQSRVPASPATDQ